MMYHFLILCSGLLFIFGQTNAQYSVLSEGRWIKATINQSGMYAVSYNQVQSAGIDPTTVDPRKTQHV